jgi:hypothetical protein
MMRPPAAPGQLCAALMDDYTQHLRRLAVHDDAQLALDGDAARERRDG